MFNKKLGLKFEKDIKLDLQIHKLIDSIWNSIFFENEFELQNNINELRNVLLRKQNEIFYGELDYIAFLIEKYALKIKYMDDGDYYFCESMINIFSGKIKEILLFLCNRTYSTKSNSFQEILKWQKQFKSFFESDLLTPYLCLTFLQTNNLEKFQKIFEELKKKYITMNNQNRLIQILSYRFIYDLKVENDILNSVKAIEQIIDKMIEVNCKTRLGYLYFEMGMQLLCKKYYLESIRCLEICIRYIGIQNQKSYIFLQYCYDMLAWNTYKIIDSSIECLE